MPTCITQLKEGIHVIPVGPKYTFNKFTPFTKCNVKVVPILKQLEKAHLLSSRVCKHLLGSMNKMEHDMATFPSLQHAFFAIRYLRLVMAIPTKKIKAKGVDETLVFKQFFNGGLYSTHDCIRKLFSETVAAGKLKFWLAGKSRPTMIGVVAGFGLAHETKRLQKTYKRIDWKCTKYSIDEENRLWQLCLLPLQFYQPEFKKAVQEACKGHEKNVFVCWNDRDKKHEKRWEMNPWGGGVCQDLTVWGKNLFGIAIQRTLIRMKIVDAGTFSNWPTPTVSTAKGFRFSLTPVPKRKYKKRQGVASLKKAKKKKKSKRLNRDSDSNSTSDSSNSNSSNSDSDFEENSAPKKRLRKSKTKKSNNKDTVDELKAGNVPQSAGTSRLIKLVAELTKERDALSETVVQLKEQLSKFRALSPSKVAEARLPEPTLQQALQVVQKAKEKIEVAQHESMNKMTAEGGTFQLPPAIQQEVDLIHATQFAKYKRKRIECEYRCEEGQRS